MNKLVCPSYQGIKTCLIYNEVPTKFVKEKVLELSLIFNFEN